MPIGKRLDKLEQVIKPQEPVVTKEMLIRHLEEILFLPEGGWASFEQEAHEKGYSVIGYLAMICGTTPAALKEKWLRAGDPRNDSRR